MLETGPRQGNLIVKFFQNDFTGRSVSYRFYICNVVIDRIYVYVIRCCVISGSGWVILVILVIYPFVR